MVIAAHISGTGNAQPFPEASQQSAPSLKVSPLHFFRAPCNTAKNEATKT